MTILCLRFILKKTCRRYQLQVFTDVAYRPVSYLTVYLSMFSHEKKKN
jgi:hypothetical protein